MVKKYFAIIGVIFLFLSFCFNTVYAVNFSESLFPSKLQRDYFYYNLDKVEKETVNGFGPSLTASYKPKSDKPSVIINPYFDLFVTLRRINNKQAVEDIIPRTKERLEKSKGSFYTNPLFGEKISLKIKDYDTVSWSYSLDDFTPGDLISGTKYYGGSVMYTTVDNYLVLVEVFYNFTTKNGKRNLYAKDALNEVELITGNFIDIIKGSNITVEESKEKPSLFNKLFGSFLTKPTPRPSPSPSVPKPSPTATVTTKQTEKLECGDLLCQSHLGENCSNCPKDCLRFPGFCCDTKSQGFISAKSYQQKRFNLMEAGGAVPLGAIAVPKEATKENFFTAFTPFVCEGGTLVAGECVLNEHCYQGVCINHQCISTTSDQIKEVTPKKAARQIIDNQEATRKAYTQAYTNIKDGVSTVSHDTQALDIKMFVQGDLVGSKMVEVVEGNEVEVVLTIENISSDIMAVVPAIIYPGAQAGTFDLTELAYTMKYRWSYNGALSWGSLIGSYMTKRFDGKFIVMFPGSIFEIYSKIVPKQTGYLDIQNQVYVSSVKRFTEPIPTLEKWNKIPTGDLLIIDQKEVIKKDTDKFEDIFDLSKGSETVLVKKKSCLWLFCL